MKVRSLLLVPLCLVLATPPTSGAEAKAAPTTDRWEPSIAKFEQSDAEQMPPAGAAVFIGSSSIRGWDLAVSFPDLKVVNRGFGGSQMADAARYVERIVIPYRPKVVVVYSGDNDVAARKGPEQIAADFAALVGKVHAALPKTRIVVIGVKPSIRRWALIDTVRATNKLLAAEAAKDARVVYVDVDTPTIGADGQPRSELFKGDGLHLNVEGYALWAALVRPHLLID